MAVCSNCHAEQPSSDLTSCILCGYPVKSEDGAGETRTDDESMDFVVTEANGDSQGFVGGHNTGGDSEDDGLGIETTTDLMAHEAAREQSQLPGGQDNAFGGPIGDSAPPPPPVAQYADQQTSSSEVPDKPSPVSNSPKTAQKASGKVKKLSEEELQKVKQNLYGSNSHLKSQEKDELADKLRSLPATNDSVKTTPQAAEQTVKQTNTAPAPPTPKPKMAKRGSGIAYYYKNFVQIVGCHGLMPNDVLMLNERPYTLKPKQIKRNYIIGASAAVFTVLLLIIAAAMSPGGDSGKGQLVGVVLDDNDQPFLQGAGIVVRGENRDVESDPRGFFNAGMLEVGTYEIEYVVDGEVVQVEQASITDGEVRMLFLRPGVEQASEEYSAEPAQQPVQVARAEPTPQPSKPAPAKKVAAAPKKTTTKSSSTSSTQKSGYAKITLDANVQNARFEVDGSILGAGNLTYSKIKSGRHRYKVSADGYESAEGKLSLSPGENHRLKITLTPMQQQQKAEVYKTDDFFYSAKSAFERGDYQTAANDFTQAINNKPSHAESYYRRAQAYDGLKQRVEAYDDYVRAAEIYQIKNDFGKAVTCYERAIETDDKTVTAYVGRGNLYLKKNEVLAAIADFDKAKNVDKRSFGAYYGLGEARFKQQQYKKAIDHFKDARKIDDQNPLVHQYLMLSYLAVADNKNVKKTFEKFAEIVTDEQMQRFKNDHKYSAVLKVVESH